MSDANMVQYAYCKKCKSNISIGKYTHRSYMLGRMTARQQLIQELIEKAPELTDKPERLREYLKSLNLK